MREAYTMTEAFLVFKKAPCSIRNSGRKRDLCFTHNQSKEHSARKKKEADRLLFSCAMGTGGNE